MITASCGHQLTDSEGLGEMMATKDNCKDGSRAVSHRVLCTGCLKWYKENGLELKTKKEQNDYLNFKK